MTNPLLTYAQVGEQLGISARSVQRLVASGKLRAVQISSRTCRIVPADLDEFVTANYINECGNSAEEETLCEKNAIRTDYTNVKIHRSGTPATPMHMGTAASAVQARIAKLKRQRS